MTIYPKSNLMTIDVEDWYHSLDPNSQNWDRYEDRIENSTNRILSIFRETGTKATFFILGHIAKRHPDLVRQIHEEGHEIASHGYEHRFIYNQTPEQFRDDIIKTKNFLESIVPEPVVSYRAPYFSITKQSLWAIKILDETGIKYDSSVHPVHNHRYGIPDASRLPYNIEDILEIPITTLPIFGVNVPCGGGVYFRFFPYALLRTAYRKLVNSGERLIFYLHPWEVDSGQPKIKETPITLSLRHYWALNRTAEKLKRLTIDFEFGTIRDGFNN